MSILGVNVMAVEIPIEFFPSVRAAIARGAYASEHEVVAYALRLWQRQEELVSKIQEGIDSLDRGEGIPSEVVVSKLKAKAAALGLEL
jgi:Arc/MetJ-type ribon-helix-helix transcriptional regulator